MVGLGVGVGVGLGLALPQHRLSGASGGRLIALVRARVTWSGLELGLVLGLGSGFKGSG